MADNSDDKTKAEFKSFAIVRVLAAVVIMVAVVWGLMFGLGYLDKYLLQPKTDTKELQFIAEHESGDNGQSTADDKVITAHTDKASNEATETPHTDAAALDHKAEVQTTSVAETTASEAETEAQAPPTADLAAAPPAPNSHHQQHPMPAEKPDPVKTPAAPKATEPKLSTQAEKAAIAEKPSTDGDHPPADEHAPTTPMETEETPTAHQEHLPPGVAFVQAAIEPLEYELKHRWWGWRPNDIINVTDNVNHFQLGVLEVARRTAVQLAERISRTGSTDAFNPHLENSMNWLMVKSDRYWFPSPETKYKESLSELNGYKQQLLENNASFYTRSDNIIPLLAAFEDLLGSCDENLVKAKEKDGSTVSFFSTDNYFYYAKGIASAMATILEAVHHDFTDVLESRNGAELLHHAILSCRRAADLDPWIITNGDLDGILANHRANMAAPISHAKFYLSQLIKTLST